GFGLKLRTTTERSQGRSGDVQRVRRRCSRVAEPRWLGSVGWRSRSGSALGVGVLRFRQPQIITPMFLRIDKLPVQLPVSPEVDPVAAKNVQELLGGRFGEMSTLMNYTYQSFGMRSREKIRPYYALV